MLKDLLTKLGLEVTDDLTEEDAERFLDEHITTLESEKTTLSQANEELTASVKGYKSREEKLVQELSETRGRLTQITDMYREQFTQDPETQEVNQPKDDNAFKDDVLQQLLDTK